MSRIGKKPIPVPKGVNVTVQPGAVEVKGPKGTLRQPVPAGVAFALQGAELVATTVRPDPALNKFHGLARTLMAPLELPVGIITAVIGGPFFLWLLLRHR